MTAKNNSDKVESKGRGRSMAGFPYVDLDNGVDTVKAVVADGRINCTFQQLADTVGVALDSNAFRIRANTTCRQYGLILLNKDQITLTELGRAIIDPTKERQARLDAFFKVSLYKDLYQRFREQTLPPPKEVERIMEELGVAPLQKARARQIFMRSAKQAGLFEHSEISLSIPSGVENPLIDLPSEHNTEKLAEVSDYNRSSAYDPAIERILRILPQPDSEWSYNERVQWLRKLSGALDVAYRMHEGDMSASIEITKRQLE